jgi:hypothetical protein
MKVYNGHQESQEVRPIFVATSIGSAARASPLTFPELNVYPEPAKREFWLFLKKMAPG